jgi:hypothetical protein
MLARFFAFSAFLDESPCWVNCHPEVDETADSIRQEQPKHWPFSERKDTPE